jgi:hypothetical protein
MEADEAFGFRLYLAALARHVLSWQNILPTEHKHVVEGTVLEGMEPFRKLMMRSTAANLGPRRGNSAPSFSAR